MTSPIEALRARLVNVLMDDDTVAGSLYLRALCCVWLASDTTDVTTDRALQDIFYAQAKREDVGGDDILTELTMLVADTEN